MQIQKLAFLAKTTLGLVRQPRAHRTAMVVDEEYSQQWAKQRAVLDAANSLDDWFCIPGHDDSEGYANIAGRLERASFDSSRFNRQKILQALQTFFPQTTSITEYGCGIGRNLLFLKRALPHLKIYGYELAQPGVEIARAAAKKFGVEAEYAQLDYVQSPDEAYVFPTTDVAFTLFSLEQLPETSARALSNIMKRTRLGSIHLEPVSENYPVTARGLMGRLYQWKQDYLRDFDRVVGESGARAVHKELVMSAHNPFMFPTLYVLEK